MKTLVENPIRRFRHNLSGKPSIESFARLLDLHHQTVYLNEQGVFPTVLPRILDYMVEQGLDKDEIIREYQEYVIYKRQVFSERVDPASFEWGEFSVDDEHPFIRFRKWLKISRMAMAKSLCIHHSFLYKLERSEIAGLSVQTKEALLAVGFSKGFIDELDFRCKEYAYVRNPQASLTVGR